MLGHAALGAWSGGRYLHFGEQVDEDRLAALLRPDARLRTVLTADVYGQGEGDRLVGRAVDGLPREDFALVGAIGHDFYEGEREGPRGYPRFTDPRLRGPGEYRDYVRTAVERSLERCGVEHFDVLLLHNPDRRGFESPEVWEALSEVRDEGLAGALGVAPGPGQRLRARPDRLPGALRRADRLGDGDPRPAGALARRAGARRLRRAGRVGGHPGGGLRRAVLGRRAARPRARPHRPPLLPARGLDRARPREARPDAPAGRAPRADADAAGLPLEPGARRRCAAWCPP